MDENKLRTYINENPEKWVYYTHQNFKLIVVKIVSEMRRKLDITPDIHNRSYVTLQIEILMALFQESFMELCGILQTFNVQSSQITDKDFMIMLKTFVNGKNPFAGIPRESIDEFEDFHKFYNEHVNALRENEDALP